MGGRWSTDQVVALAPDPAAVSAGRRLAVPGPWTSTGASLTPFAIWGLCSGSGSRPYQTIVDLSGPAYRCSCPSRKFPCKHALGLLLLWAGGQVRDEPEPSDFATAWLAGRAGRVTATGAAGGNGVNGAEKPAAADGSAANQLAAAARAQQRAARVTSGITELEQWLRDRIRTGLAGADRAGYGPTDQVAARLVDAQAPGLANWVRNLAGVAASGDGWPSRLLTEFALLHLLAAAHQRIGELPGDLASTVRSRVGYTTRTADVLAAPGVRDFWNVLCLDDDQEDRLTVRRVQLHGSRTGRAAVVLSFSAGGQPLDASLVPGTCIDADLHFYPAAVPSRAIVGARHGERGPLMHIGGLSIEQAVEAWAAALAADPWTSDLPVVLDAVVPLLPASAPGRRADGWLLMSAATVEAATMSAATVETAAEDLASIVAGGAPAPPPAVLPLLPSERLWVLLAVSGGSPVTVAGSYTPRGLRAVAVRAGDRMVAL